MKKKNVLQQAVALTLALGISLSGSLTAFAEPYLGVDFSVVVSDSGESRTFVYGTAFTFQKTISQVIDVNATFNPSSAKTTDVGEIIGIDYGYLENDKFISTDTNYDIKNVNGLDETYPVFDKIQVQKDLQSGITDRVYGVMVLATDMSWNGVHMPFLFKLSGSTASSITAGWVQDTTGWWYRNADGSYPINAWKEINGKQYYFGADGYMLHDDITPDGYTVGSDGVWVQYTLPDTRQKMIDEFINLYEGAFYIDEAEFEDNVKTFILDPVEAEQVINEIRNNHTFVPGIF